MKHRKFTAEGAENAGADEIVASKSLLFLCALGVLCGSKIT
jgi:hypothetical protein